VLFVLASALTGTMIVTISAPAQSIEAVLAVVADACGASAVSTLKDCNCLIIFIPFIVCFVLKSGLPRD